MDAAAGDLETDGCRVPEFLLPNIAPDTLKAMRPEILLIEGLPAHPTAEEIERVTRIKSEITIKVVELGYCNDFDFKAKEDEKKQQHATLVAALREAHWTVQEEFIVLGSMATIYHAADEALQHLGLSPTQAKGLLSSLHVHACNMLRETICTRRQLENTISAPHRSTLPPRRGVG